MNNLGAYLLLLNGGGGGVPFYSRIVQLLQGGIKSGTDDELADAKVPQIVTDNAQYVQSNCLTMNGTDDTIAVGGLTSSNVVTLGAGSTATPTAGTDEITFTSGIVGGIYIDGELVYPCAEGESHILISVSDNWGTATLVSPTNGLSNVRTKSDDVTPWNMKLGFSLWEEDPSFDLDSEFDLDSIIDMDLAFA